MKVSIFIITFILSIITKIYSNELPFLASHVNLGRLFSILFFGNMLISSWNIKGIRSNITPKNIYLSFYTTVSLFDFMNNPIPYISEHTLQIILILFAGNFIFQSIKLKSIRKGFEAIMPEKNLRLSKKERKLRRALWKYIRHSLKKEKTYFLELDEKKEEKIKLISWIVTISYIGISIILNIYFNIPLWVDALLILLVPYFLSWTIGTIQLCRTSSWILKNDTISLNGLYELSFGINDVERVEEVITMNKNDFNFGYLAIPKQRVIFKKEQEIWKSRTIEKVRSIVVPFKIDYLPK